MSQRFGVVLCTSLVSVSALSCEISCVGVSASPREPACTIASAVLHATVCVVASAILRAPANLSLVPVAWQRASGSLLQAAACPYPEVGEGPLGGSLCVSIVNRRAGAGGRILKLVAQGYFGMSWASFRMCFY